MWVVIWCALVVGACVALALVGRDTWRRGSAALREVGAASEAAEGATARAQARGSTMRPLPVPVLAAERRDLVTELNRVRAARRARAALREQRRRSTYTRWLAHWR